MCLKQLAFVIALAAVAGPALAADDADLAAKFGAREAAAQASLSPDGKSVAFIASVPGRGSALLTGSPETGLKVVMRSSGAPDRLQGCQWSTNTRLVCRVFMIIANGADTRSFTRMMAVDADGSHLKMLSARQSDRALDVAQNGGSIIDWLGDDAGGNLLMTRTFVPEDSIGTYLASDKEGLGVEKLDVNSMARVTVEEPSRSAVEYITDGHGAVRVRGMRQVDGAGYVANTLTYYYRAKDARDWKLLSRVSVLGGEGFDPYAVDRDLDVAYGFERLDGRQALFKIALDGSMKRELVFARPDVDVDGLIRIGRQHRVVGVSFATDKRQSAFFDPELKTLAAKLSKALPGLPLVTFVDASTDESKLLIWAGSDVDPGRYFLYDKNTRKLEKLLDVRPELADVHLAPVKPVTFAAADGTAIPAYLTLPPGSEGKNLPAIVMPHGGPGARDEWGFDWLSQYFANRGFAVLQPNFRGSTGYGEGWFKQNGFQSWRAAIGDVNDGGRWLIKQGIAQPNRLAIFGWSYGGYAALQSAVLDPSLFKAIVAVAPVTDLGTLRSEAVHYANFAEVDALIGKGPHVREGSPAQNAERIKAPVLIFHGRLDQNVAIGQSRLMVSRLGNAGVKPQFVEYDGLDHYLEDSTVRADLLGKADAFFRKSMGM